MRMYIFLRHHHHHHQQLTFTILYIRPYTVTLACTHQQLFKRAICTRSTANAKKDATLYGTHQLQQHRVHIKRHRMRVLLISLYGVGWSVDGLLLLLRAHNQRATYAWLVARCRCRCCLKHAPSSPEPTQHHHEHTNKRQKQQQHEVVAKP